MNNNIDKIKSYKELCGVTNKDIVIKGKLTKTEQYLGQILNNQKPCSNELMYEILNAISVARAVRLREKVKEEQNYEK